VTQSFSNDILLQIIAALGGKPDFNALTIEISDTPIYYGRFLTAIVNFVIVAFAMFLVVKAINRLQNLRAKEEVQEAEITEVELLTEIRDLLRTRV
jgi:large conductance mechanosensitive channel